MPQLTPNSSNSITLRLHIPHQSSFLAKVTEAIGVAEGFLSAATLVEKNSSYGVWDVTVDAASEAHAQAIVSAIKELPETEVLSVQDCTFELHRQGKISVESKHPIENKDQLSMAYTPGVGRVCSAIANDKAKVFDYTIKGHTVAVISDGSAVLGLGNIGPEAAIPVMEGKAMIFKAFAGLDAFPICLDTQDVEAIIQTVQYLAPVFGGINLEDISAPRCFEIEDRLKELLDIPVMHDDQHGTAVVTLAALLNARKIVNKKLEDLKIVFTGVGAAGVACTKILLQAGVKNIIGCDTAGAIYQGREHNMNATKILYAELTNPQGEQGTIQEVIKGADVFVGLSGPGTVSLEDIQNMAEQRIVFAMANPVPEIPPELAGPHVAVMATGRSDYPNQINNALAYPGIFKGALNCKARTITEEMKMAAAQALADLISPEELRPDYIIPSVFDPRVVPAVALAVEQAAQKAGVVRTI
jgi:malate dehydrogenase (oxaloacetate-decarboxylating)